MAWTGNFRGVDYKKRAELLLNYLKQRPDGLANCRKRRPNKQAQMSSVEQFCYGYKDVLSYIVSSLCVRSEYRYISKEAEKQLKSHGITKPVYNYVYSTKIHDEYKGLTNEHTIPVSVIVKHLASLGKAQLTVDFLADFIEKVSGLALILLTRTKN